jgi:hypothetical protein
MALLIAAALAGVFGSGPLSRARAEAGGVEIEYDRFARRTKQSELRIRAVPRPGTEPVRIAIDNAFMRDIKLESVAPAPERIESGGERTTFVFRPPSDAGPLEAVLLFKPQRAGRLEGKLSVNGAAPLSWGMLVYP